ncbi:uncharacterized protein K460DRAFT_273358, partial [Cucurbitaria berberidis CBS 394.84]
VDSCPRGYPQLAAFLDSDECFSVYRRFGFLQSRLLLDKQETLRGLEEALDKLDKREAKADLKRPMTTDLPHKEVEPRRKLLAAIEGEFTAYANLLDTAAKMMALNHPSRADFQSVQNYMDNRQPLLEAEASWVRKKEDLITLRVGREHAWLDSGIEKLLKSVLYLFTRAKRHEILAAAAAYCAVLVVFLGNVGPAGN